MPKGLYARSLLIIIVPMVVLQSVVAFMFMERHWNLVTSYLSSAVTQEIATLIDVYKTYPQDADRAQLRRIAQDRLGLVVDFLPRSAIAAAGAEAVFLAARRGAVGRNPQADRPAVLDRYGRPSVDRRNPHQARRHDHARVRAARRRLRSEFLDLPALDGGDLAGGARRRHPVPAQPDPADRAACRRRRSVRQGPRGAEFPSARRARSAARGGRVPGNEGPRRARHRAAHHHARRRVARSAHRADPLQARTRACSATSRKSRRSRRTSTRWPACSRPISPSRAATSASSRRRPTWRRCSKSSRLDTERHGHRASVAFHGQPEVTVRPAAFKRCLANLVSNAARFASTVADHRPPRPPLAHGDGGRRRAGHPARNCARTCSSRSCGSTTRAIRTRAAPASASPSPATSRARTAATSRSATVPLGGLRATVRVPV